jgi:hypothetical protein
LDLFTNKTSNTDIPLYEYHNNCPEDQILGFRGGDHLASTVIFSIEENSLLLHQIASYTQKEKNR